MKYTNNILTETFRKMARYDVIREKYKNRNL